MQDYYADEIGVLSPNQLQVDELYAGEVDVSPLLVHILSIDRYSDIYIFKLSSENYHLLNVSSGLCF